MSRLVNTRLRVPVQLSGLVRKEVAQTLRQPQLLLLLVGGPFVILLIFGFGYDEDQMALRTQFVGPPDSVYEEAIAEHSDQLSSYIVPVGYTSDVVGARRDLAEGNIDLVVILPTDAAESLADGGQAEIVILHDKIDPVQLTAVQIASQLAVGEVNATVLETMIGQGLDGLRPVNDYLNDAVLAAGNLEQASRTGDTEAVEEHHDELDTALGGAETALMASATVLRQLDPEGASAPQAEVDQVLADIRSVRSDANRFASMAADGETPTEAANLSRRVGDITTNVSDVINISPEVIVRPFSSSVARIGDQWITPTDFFAPATIALLLAHLGVTFAAMSVVADRRLGVFETYRVAPMGAGQVVSSKYLAFLLLGAVVGGALLTLVVLALGVPMLGNVLWVVAVVAGLVLASVGLGLIVSALARTDSQAVQYAMLVLLAGLFFGGFFLELDAFAPAVQVLAHALPVTYGISMLHDVMLRGLEPDLVDGIGLAALVVVYGFGAAWLMRRQLRAQ